MFNETNLKNTEIENTNFSRCNLDNCNFQGGKLNNVDLGIPKADFLGHNDSVNSIVFSKNGRYLISGSSDHLIKIWNYENGR